MNKQESAVNNQILDAVAAVHQSAESALKVANTLVYQQIAHSITLAVQDAVNALRTTLTIDNAITAKVMAQLLAGETSTETAVTALRLAQDKVQQSIDTLDLVTFTVTDILNQLVIDLDEEE